MIDLVLTYLDHHWGHLWWLAILGQFGNDQNVSLELISVHQTIKGDPNDGLDKLKPNRSYLNHVLMWYSKSINLPLKFCLIPIKRQKFKFAKEGSLKSKNARKETSLRIKKYKEKSVSQYVKWAFLILPPNSMHPNDHVDDNDDDVDD